MSIHSLGMVYCPGYATREGERITEPHDADDDFYIIKGQRDRVCRPCRRKIQIRYERRYEDRVRLFKVNAARKKRWSLILYPDGDGGWRSFTDDDFDHEFIKQDGRCLICGLLFAGKRMPDVDHDHVTERFRGLLCGRHNKALGLFNDDPRLLRTGAEYLERHDRLNAR